MGYMLSYTVNGIKNIEKPIRLDFYKKTVDKEADFSEYRIKAIFGENGSGKTGIVTSAYIMKKLLVDGRFLLDSDNECLLGNVINKRNNRLELSCEYYDNTKDKGVIYRYSVVICLDEQRRCYIEKELLEKRSANYIGAKYIRVFETESGSLKYIDGTQQEYIHYEKNTMNLLTKTSFVAWFIDNLASKGESHFIEDVIGFYFNVLKTYIYLDKEDRHTDFINAQKLRALYKYNANISDIEYEFISLDYDYVPKKHIEIYEKKIAALTKFIQLFKTDLVSIDIEKKENKDNYLCNLIFNYGDYSIDKEFESTGIKKLIKVYEGLSNAADGCTVIYDELDANINDIFFCKMIEYIKKYADGQLCFTTHNLDVMDVVKDSKKSIDFLSSDGYITSWTVSGNMSPANAYRNGAIDRNPLNIFAVDFIGVLGGAK